MIGFQKNKTNFIKTKEYSLRIHREEQVLFENLLKTSLLG